MLELIFAIGLGTVIYYVAQFLIAVWFTVDEDAAPYRFTPAQQDDDLDSIRETESISDDVTLDD